MWQLLCTICPHNMHTIFLCFVLLWLYNEFSMASFGLFIQSLQSWVLIKLCSLISLSRKFWSVKKDLLGPSYHFHIWRVLPQLSYYDTVRGNCPSNSTLWLILWHWDIMTSSNGNIFRVTDPLWGGFTGRRWIPLTGQWHWALLFSLICPSNKRLTK